MASKRDQMKHGKTEEKELDTLFKERHGDKEKSRHHSHKKRKDSLEASLILVLFETEPDLPKILVPRLPQNSSNINIESDGKSK